MIFSQNFWKEERIYQNAQEKEKRKEKSFSFVSNAHCAVGKLEQGLSVKVLLETVQ